MSSAGKGALARHRDFWYPVRLLQRITENSWQVSWWRGNKYGDITPDLGAHVDVANLVDELWADVQGRRQIQVSKATTHVRLLNLFMEHSWVNGDMHLMNHLRKTSWSIPMQ